MPPTSKKTYNTDWKSNNATDNAISKFEELFGKEMGAGKLSRDLTVNPYEVIPTGILALDFALGIGGMPLGRVVESWGPEHAGKTTVAMLQVAQAQRTYKNKMCAWVDMEQTFDKKWAKTLGVDLNRLWLFENPKTAEDVADSVKRFVESGLCSLVVLDSIGGMIGRKEFEKESDEATVAEVARIVTRMVKQVSPIGHSNGTTTYVINQVRSKIGGYGPSEHTSGGWALKHITTIRMTVRRGGEMPRIVKVGDEQLPVSYNVRIKIEKNKTAPYGRTADFWITNQATDKWGPIGVDPIAEALDFGIKVGVIEQQPGGYYIVPDAEDRIRGRETVGEFLRENPKSAEKIRDLVLASIKDTIRDETDDDAEDPAGMGEYLAANT